LPRYIFCWQVDHSFGSLVACRHSVVEEGLQ